MDLGKSIERFMGMMRMKRLTDICEIQYGYAFDSKYFTQDSSYPQLVRIRDVKRGYSETYYSGDYPEEYILSEGDLLVGMDGEFNIARWKCSRALLNQRVCKLTAKVGTNEEYLRFAMSKSLKKIEQRTAFVTVKHLSAKELNKLELDVPELAKQDKIADTLSRLERIIESRKEELEILENLIKARFVEMFGNPIVNEKRWAVVELNSVCDGIGDGLHGTPEYDEKGRYPFINGNNLMNDAIEVTPATKMVDEATYKRHFIELSNNAILLSINGTLGKLAFYNGEEVMLGKSACYCNLKPCINRDFVYGVMKTDAFTGFLESNSTASTIKNVGLKAIRGFMLIMPPEELQTRYVEFAKQVDKSKVIAYTIYMNYSNRRSCHGNKF